MSRVPDRVRQLVVQWPEDAPRGEIDAFCRSHGVSRSWFFDVRRRAVVEGESALFKRSTRPHSSPTAVPDSTVAAVIAMRRVLVEEGKDHGPLSIIDVMERSGFVPLPSRTTVARILDREELVDRNKRKRPKRSHVQIRSEYPNQRWQSDGLEVTLTTGEVVVVIEVIDDCTRFNIMLHPGPAENAVVVVDAFRLAIARHGRPVLVHTDNGAAFNMGRVGKVTALQRFLNDLGVKMITGRPRHPKSQGKVERAHQTLLKFINVRRPATLEQLRTILDEYRTWYNHHRSHQSLPPRTAPADLYETMPKVAPPGDPITPSVPARTPSAHIARQSRYNAVLQTRKANRNGLVRYVGHTIMLGNAWRGQHITIIRAEDQLQLFDSRGEELAIISWPAPLTAIAIYSEIGNHQPPPEQSTMS